MATGGANQESGQQELTQVLEELAALRRFTGEPKQFWPTFLSVAGRLMGADIAVLILGSPGKTPRWGKIGEWISPAGRTKTWVQFATQLEPLAERVLSGGDIIEMGDPATGHFTLAVRLKLSRPEDEVILAAQLHGVTPAAAQEAFVRLRLAADVPAGFQQAMATQKARYDMEKFAAVLDLNVPINEATQFLPAALAFCNGIATRFRCDRASLGWVEGGYVRLRAISRTEQFDRQMAAAQAMEVAMEECVDQDEEIVWPEEKAATITRDHEKFGVEQKSGNVCSIPLRLDGNVVGVLMCERQEGAFNAVELQQLRLCCDQNVRRLSELKHYDRWFGARWAAQSRDYLKRWLGPEHTWSKVTAIFIALVILALFLVRVNYRVEGNFILRSDEAEYLTAPFDGYIEEVLVRPGDHVAKGQTLLTLNRSELLLDQSAAVADVARYQREMEKDRAANDIAQMRIDDAQARQAQAQLDLIHYRLDHAVIKSGLDGVVVEGDLRERIASPVKQGDALLKVARIDTLYAEADIPERDVKEILGRTHGEIAFVTQPKLKYPVTVEMIEPAAVTKKDGNVFLVRLKPDAGAMSWWRPGMTGLCKITAEKRTLFWILTHRTVDFLRQKLWW